MMLTVTFPLALANGGKELLLTLQAKVSLSSQSSSSTTGMFIVCTLLVGVNLTVMGLALKSSPAVAGLRPVLVHTTITLNGKRKSPTAFICTAAFSVYS